MYFNSNQHLLSQAIMKSAVIRSLTAVMEGIARLILNRNQALTPDMLNSVLWNTQIVFAILQILAISAVFLHTWKKLTRLKSVVSEDDVREMGRLQEEVLGRDLSSLSVTSISQLLEIWAVVLIGAEIIYCVSSAIYRNFTAWLLLLSFVTDPASFTRMYNMTHGFKSLEMMTAILLGVAMTGIFLKDRYLKGISAVTAALFLTAFGFLEMMTVRLPGRVVGLVWTSVIFHVTDTVGLFILALYLAKHYRGL